MDECSIATLLCHEIIDSWSNPTAEGDVELADGSPRCAAVSSGALTRTHELYDGDERHRMVADTVGCRIELVQTPHPILSLEDGCSRDDRDGWQARATGCTPVMSRRSGETEGAIIAGSVVATDCSQIKVDSLFCSDRRAKSNPFPHIERARSTVQTASAGRPAGQGPNSHQARCPEQD